jgi:WD40 repeat protein
VPTLALVKQYTNIHTKSVNAICFAPDGNSIVSGGAHKLITVMRLASEERFYLHAHTTAEITCLAFSRDAHILASGSVDSYISLFDFANRTKIKVI